MGSSGESPAWKNNVNRQYPLWGNKDRLGEEFKEPNRPPHEGPAGEVRTGIRAVLVHANMIKEVGVEGWKKKRGSIPEKRKC